MALTFPSDAQRGIPAWLTKFTATLIRARYRTSVGDSNAAGKVPLTIQGAPSQTANLLEFYDGSKNGLAAVDASGNLIQSGVTNALQCVKQVTLTAAQIITLNSVPVTVIAAPGAGKAILVTATIFQFKYGTVQMTGGGAVNPVYHGATTNLLSGSVAAATIQAAASANISCGAPAAALSLTTNTAVDLRAATADFAAGDSTAVLTIYYSVITAS